MRGLAACDAYTTAITTADGEGLTDLRKTVPSLPHRTPCRSPHAPKKIEAGIFLISLQSRSCGLIRLQLAHTHINTQMRAQV